MDETLKVGKEKLPSRVYSKELIELLFHQPYIKSEALVRAAIVGRKTASVYLKELEKAGIVKGQKVGRENLYLNVRLYDLLFG